MGAGDLPDGPVTIMFTDLEGSTALRTRLGDVEADSLFSQHDALVREQITAHGGFDQGASLGDGFLAIFTSTRRAVSCAIAIQAALRKFNRSSAGPRLRVRIGLNTGEVGWRDGQLSGESVHAAARVCSAATGGQILVADVTRQLAGTIPGTTFSDAGEFQLKGFPVPWRLWEVEEAAASPTPASVFVGRVAELARLREAMHAALDGRGGVVLVGGEPGVGKTALVRQLIAEAQRSGAIALIGRCYESEGTIPYAPFVEMLEQALSVLPPDIVRADMADDAAEVARMVPELRRRFADIADPLDLPAEQRRRYFFNAVASFVARSSGRFPLLLVIDDVHWADEPTLLLTEHMATLLPGLPILCIGTYRDTELEVSRPLAGTVERLVRERLVDMVSLRRFDSGTVADMLERLAGTRPPEVVVDAVHAETDGNPFFVEEVYRHLVEDGRMFDASGAFRTDVRVEELDVPESVRLVVGRRLERLGPDVQRVLAVGAVAGRAFPFRLLEEAADIDAGAVLDAVEAAEAAHVVVAEERDGDVHYRFGHELIRQTLLSGLSVVRRQRLHLTIADAIEATDPRALDDRPSEIAGHLVLAGAAAGSERTLHALERAVDRALEAAAYEEALRAAESALEIAKRSADRLRWASLSERRGRALRGLGSFQECIRLWGDVAEVFASEGLSDQAGELCHEAAYLCSWINQFDDAFTVVERGLEIVHDERSTLRARLLAMKGCLLGLAGFDVFAQELLAEADEIARELGDQRALGRTLWARSVSEWVNLRSHAAIESSAGAIEALEAANDQWALVDALAWGTYPRAFRATPESLAESVVLAQRTIELARRLGHRAGEALGARAVLISAGAPNGDLDVLEEHARRDVDAFSAIDSPWVTQSHTILAHVLLLRGDLDGALHHARVGSELEFPSAFFGAGWSMLALVHAWRREAEASDALIAEHLITPAKGERPSIGTYAAMMTVVEVWAVLGRRSDAGSLHPLLVPWMDEMPMSGWDLTVAERPAAMAAAAGRRFVDAERLFEMALERNVAMPNVFDLARTQLWYGDMLLERGGDGDADRADRLLRDALAAFERTGMPLHARRARQRLAEARTGSR